MKLRGYQIAAADAIFDAWTQAISTLVVMPTGSGKSILLSEIIRRVLPKRSLVIQHLDELIYQNKQKIEAVAKVDCQIEMAEQRACVDLFTRTPCVLATVQTLHKRLNTFDPNSFGLVVVDEAHRTCGKTYGKIIDHFKQNKELKVLGVTATPDRFDEEALGKIYETVAYDYEILDAIHDGWLVPVEQQFVRIADLDYSRVRTTAGDLNEKDLAELMETEKNLQGVCGSSIEILGNRQAILFAASINHAQMACEIFNRHRPGMASFVCGKTDKAERKKNIQEFRDRKTQVLCNCGVFTEGADFPNVSVIIMAKATQSRSRYAQMCGRALRPLTGLVDGLETPEERRAAIAASSKPSALLIDFVGNSGKHKLMTSADILGGKVSDEAVELAISKSKAASGSVRMVEVLAEAEEELKRQREQKRLAEEARRARIIADVRFTKRQVDPFDAMDITPVQERGWNKNKKPTDKMNDFLMKNGINPKDLTFTAASQLIGKIIDRRNKDKCTWKMAKLLKSYGLPGDLPFSVAKKAIDAIASNHWKLPPNFDISRL